MSEARIELELRHKQETNMGCNISTVRFNQPTTVQDIIDYALSHKDCWGEMRIVDETLNIFKWTDTMDYSQGKVDTPFKQTDLKSIVVKADCWHSFNNADYYIAIAEMESE